MAISVASTSFSVGLGNVDTTQGGHGIYRVGDAGVIINGSLIASFNDEGQVFAATSYADTSNLGRFGSIEEMFVHDNDDGTMTVYYQQRAGLPIIVTNWQITLDATTGQATGPATQILSGAFSTTTSSMLQFAADLPGSDIFMINPAGQGLVVEADGTVQTTLAALGGIGATAVQGHNVDVAVSGDLLFYAYIDNTAGEAGPVFVQTFDLTDGSEARAPVEVSEGTQSGFGTSPSVRIETLANGNVVVVWVDAATQPEDTDSTSVWFRIFDTDGVEITGPTLVNSITTGRQDTPVLFTTESGFVVGYSVLDFQGTQEGRLNEYSLTGALIDSETAAYDFGTGAAIRTDNNTAFILDGEVVEVFLPGDDTPLDVVAPPPVVPTSGADTLTGTSGADQIDALEGNDVLDGLDGNDTLFGNIGADSINGGDGNDSISGGSEADTINAGAGNDTVRGDNGRDLVQLNQGDDVYFDNGQGGSFGRDTVFGGDGNDTIQGGNGDDAFYGGNGSDLINGRLGNDLILGGTGADTLSGGAGNDTIEGGDGPDRVFLGTGNDLFNDNGQGGTFGQDTVYGGAGSDTIEGGAGNDRFLGGDGNDLIFARGGADSVVGGTGADTLNSGDGNDTVDGGNGQDLVLLGRGNDLFNDNAQGGTFGRDTVSAGEGNDTINGGAGADNFFGGDGNDLINGGLGADLASGGNGADTLVGGIGNDTLTGGADADTFVFAASDATAGTDLVTDFEFGTDVFELSGTTSASVSVGYDGMSNQVTVSIGTADLVVLRGPADLSGFGVDDIVFV